MILNKEDFKISFPIQEKISKFDRKILNLLLESDDGSGWMYFSWNQELIDKLNSNADPIKLLNDFIKSLEKWSQVEITAKQTDLELFSRIIASFRIIRVKENVTIIVNLSKEFIMTIPSVLFIAKDNKKV